MALKARGVDLVYSRYQKVEITGELPNRGGKYSAKCRVADIVPLTVMKSVCMEDRYKTKDAYDLYYTIRHYPGGIPVIVDALKPDLENGLVREALQRLQQLFASPDSAGPSDIANFLEAEEQEERDLIMRDAFETFKSLFDALAEER